jgi:hypothetical protein
MTYFLMSKRPSWGRAAWHGSEYSQGTLSLYATFDTKPARRLGRPQNAPGRYHRESTAGNDIRVIADNLSAHHHFTPTYFSWCNQVEPWFTKI